jgi:hypothetical protein
MVGKLHAEAPLAACFFYYWLKCYFKSLNVQGQLLRETIVLAADSHMTALNGIWDLRNPSNLNIIPRPGGQTSAKLWLFQYQVLISIYMAESRDTTSTRTHSQIGRRVKSSTPQPNEIRWSELPPFL